MAELFSWVLLPYCSPPGCPFPIKSLALSAHVSPRTIHFWVVGRSPLLGPGRGPPSCNIPTFQERKLRSREAQLLSKCHPERVQVCLKPTPILFISLLFICPPIIYWKPVTCQDWNSSLRWQLEANQAWSPSSWNLQFCKVLGLINSHINNDLFAVWINVRKKKNREQPEDVTVSLV